MLLFTIYLTFLFTSVLGRFRHPIINPYGKFKEVKESLFDEDPEAKVAAEVHLEDFKSVVSYSGYITVDDRYDSNLFFWFFPSENDYDNDPVLLWLQGGPGSSGTIGLFTENGPFIITESGGIELREHSWTKNHSVLFVDSPVGTGYSFTNGGYAENETKVGEDLYSALEQFYAICPELLENDFYITGESYAGKYIPALAYTIYKKNQESLVKIPLRGISIGNGLSDPVNQLAYSDYLYQLGLIDSNTKKKFKQAEEEVRGFIEKEDYVNATTVWDGIVNGDFNNGNTLFAKNTGFVNYFNYLYPTNPVKIESIPPFLQRSDVRRAIHVGNLSIHAGDSTVEHFLEADLVRSVAPWISELLSNYRVLIYNGQLDIIVAYPLTVNYLQKLNFSSAEEYKTAPRKLWYVGDDLAGYVKEAGNLTEILVRDAGHFVPADQPVWAYDMIYKFVRNMSIA